MKKIHVIATLILAMLAPVLATGQDSTYVHDSRFPFIIITKDSTTAIPEMDDEEFYRNSQGVIFKVNRTEIPADDHFMTLYQDSVLPWLNAQRLQPRKLFIRGAASPEGPYANNQRLGKGRTAALLEELRHNLWFQYKDKAIGTSSITEDYGYLCLLMKEAGDPDYQIVKDIYDKCQGNELACKKQLMAYNGQRLWNRLLREYFPKLRAARVILWFSETEDFSTPSFVFFPFAQREFPTVELTKPTVSRPFLAVTPETGRLQTIEEPMEPKVRRHVVAVRTNLLHDFFYMPRYGWAPTPNLQLEFYPWNGHLTFNMGLSWMTMRQWHSHRFYQVRDVQLELRRYFKGKGRFLGFYMGAAAEGTVYGIGLNSKEGWEGEGGALSLTAGYVTPLTKRKNFRLEFMLAAGYFFTRHDPYVYGNPITGTEDGKYYYNYLGSASKFRKRNHMFSWLGPTNVGIQLTYDILYRQRKSVQKRIANGKLLKENCF